MGRNGPFGTLRGFDAFGKVSHLSTHQTHTFVLDAHPPSLSISLRPSMMYESEQTSVLTLL